MSIALRFALAAALSTSLPGVALAEQAQARAVDTPYASNTSIKCEVGEIPDTSIRRLAHCDSARFVSFSDGAPERDIVRFEIRPEDEKISNGNRAELRDMHEAVNDQEVWYRLSTMLPEDFPIDATHRLVLAQWHERLPEGTPSLRPPLSHRLWNGRFVITLWNQDIIDARGRKGDGEILYDLPELERGVFHDFVYRVVWSTGEKGRILGWKRTCPAPGDECDGAEWQRIVDFNGPTGYDQAIGYYFKYGLYTVSDFDATFTAYHRDARIGATPEDIGADPVKGTIQ